MVPAPHVRLKLMPECRASCGGVPCHTRKSSISSSSCWSLGRRRCFSFQGASPKAGVDRMARQEVARTTPRPRRRLPGSTVGILAVALALFSQAAKADEGGVSFWVPGFFGSLAAAPQVPGFSWANIYYHTSVKAGADVAFARQVSRGRITTNFTANLSANLDADADLGIRHSAVRLRDAVPGRPGRRGPDGAVRPQHRLRRRDADRRTGPVRLHRVGRAHRLA